MRFFVPLMCVAGCQLVYDFEAFEPPEDPVDPTELAVSKISPSTVVEGSGCLLPSDEPMAQSCTEGSPGVVVVLEGENIAANAEVTLTGYGFEGPPPTVAISATGKHVAFVVPIAVDRDLPDGVAVPVEVTVSQPLADPVTIEFNVIGLDEYRSSSSLDALGGRHLYSEVVVDAVLTLEANDSFALFEATTRVLIEADVIGAEAGCAGGEAGMQGSCERNGLAASGMHGAGGGGNATRGNGGLGDPLSNGGLMTSAELLTPLEDVSGGGGGGGAAAGGAGGAAIGFSSRGTLVVSGLVNVSGAEGAQTGNCVTNGASGGGAGGAIFLRANAALDATELTVNIDGASGGESLGNCDGGQGSDGLVRLDGPEPSIVGAPSGALRGPIIVSPMLIAASSPQSITVAASNLEQYWLKVNDSAPTAFTLTGSTTELMPDLEAGHNTVCVLAIEQARAGISESLSCVDIAFIQ